MDLSDVVARVDRMDDALDNVRQWSAEHEGGCVQRDDKNQLRFDHLEKRLANIEGILRTAVVALISIGGSAIIGLAGIVYVLLAHKLGLS